MVPKGCRALDIWAWAFIKRQKLDLRERSLPKDILEEPKKIHVRTEICLAPEHDTLKLVSLPLNDLQTNAFDMKLQIQGLGFRV